MVESPSEPTQRRVEFLVAGMARSGTTILQRIASELNNVWVPAETHFWRHAARLARTFPPPLDVDSARKAVEWFAALESSARLEISAEEVVNELGGERMLWDLFDATVRHLSPEEAMILGEKTPDHLRWASQLMISVPHLKVVGVVRDPREVFRSQQSVPWGIRDPWTFAEKWVQLTRLVEDCSDLHGDRFLAFRYENVVRAPSETRTAIAELLGIPDDRDADFAAHSDRLFPGTEWWKEGALQPIAEREDRWADELSSEDIRIIEARTHRIMERWGYEPTGSGSPRTTPPPGLFDIRRAGANAITEPLPIVSQDIERWTNSTAAELDRWRKRAELFQSQQQNSHESAERWKARAEELRQMSQDASIRVEELAKDVTTQSARVASWKGRAEELKTELERDRLRLSSSMHTEQLRRLETERAYRVTKSRLNRLEARRWWKLAGVLSHWRRRPWAVPTLVRESWALRHQGQLPPAADVLDLESQIRTAKAILGKVNAPQTDLADARSAYRAGDYEGALELIEAAPGPVREATEGWLLRRDCYIRLGELTSALRCVRAAIAAGGHSALATEERMLIGRLRETDSGWLPSIALPPAATLAKPPAGKILHLLKESLPFFERGYTMRSQMTLVAQRQAGFDPEVVTSLGFPREQGFSSFPLYETIDSTLHHRLDLGDHYSTVATPYDQVLSDQATLVARIADKIRPSLIQAGSGYRGYETALVGLAVARRLKVPMIYEIRSFLEQTWTAEVDRSEKGEHYERRFSQEIRCLHEADHVITIAEAMRDEIAERGIDINKISVVPNVVDITRFKPRPRPTDLAAHYHLESRKVLGYISNLGPREGIHNLVKAVSILRARGENVAGLIVGDGPEKAQLLQLVDELDLNDQVVVTGHVPNHQIEDHYALIDLFVVPRIDDRAARLVTPLKPLEAMAMGVPVIASDLPALREMIAPGERGSVFQPDDPADLAQVAGDLLNDETARGNLAAGAQEWVRTDRTVEANAERYRKILENVLGVTP